MSEQAKNEAVLDAVNKMLNEDKCYQFIPKVIRQSDYMEWFEIELDSFGTLTVKKHGAEVFHVTWSYNEPKIYFTSGILQMRLQATEEALKAAIFAMDSVKRTFRKELENHEL
jgi:hypothetical protein